VNLVKRAPRPIRPHAYKSGLIDTSVLSRRSWTSGQAFCKVRDRDLLFWGLFSRPASAWTPSNRVTESTTEGRLIGHLVMGAWSSWTARSASSIAPGRLPARFRFDKAFLVKHVILAHPDPRVRLASVPNCRRPCSSTWWTTCSQVNAIRCFIEPTRLRR